MAEFDRFERLKSKLEYERRRLNDAGLKYEPECESDITSNFNDVMPFVETYERVVMEEFPELGSIDYALGGHDLFVEMTDNCLSDEKAIDWIVEKVREHLTEGDEEERDVDEGLITEGTGNFKGDGGADWLPLLVFMTDEEVYDRLKYSAEREYEGHEDEVEWDEFYNDFCDEHFDEYSNGVCVLDEYEDGEKLDNDIYEFNGELKARSSEVEDYDRSDALRTTEVEIEPGYYEGAQILCDFHGLEEFLNDEDKKLIIDFFEKLKKEYGLSELSVAYRGSNGETGYKLVEASEVKKEGEKDKKKTYAIAVSYADNDDFDIFTYDTKEEMVDAYDKAKHSYLINGREWHEISLDVFGACEDCEDEKVEVAKKEDKDDVEVEANESIKEDNKAEEPVEKDDKGKVRRMSDGPLDFKKDGRIDESKESEIKNILKPRIVDGGMIKPFADDEKLPRGFRFLAGTVGKNQRGYVRYKGDRYWYEVKDGDVEVVRESMHEADNPYADKPKLKKEKGVHVNLNAGNPEKNMAAFNHNSVASCNEDIEDGSSVVDDAIMTNSNDEREAIVGYDCLEDIINNSSLSEEEKAKALAVIHDIRDEEYKHIGQLNQLLKSVSKNADDIEAGENEAKGQENGVIEKDEKEIDVKDENETDVDDENGKAE